MSAGQFFLALGAGVFSYVWLAGDIVPVGIGLAVSVVCAVATLICSERRSWTPGNTALCALLLKLAQLPAYFVLLCSFGLGGVSDEKTARVLGIALLIILCSGFVGLAAVRRYEKEGIFTEAQAGLHSVLQFIFVLDLFSVIYMNGNKVHDQRR